MVDDRWESRILLHLLAPLGFGAEAENGQEAINYGSVGSHI